MQHDKKCTKCGELKALDQFSPDVRQQDGRQSHCKECKNSDARIRRAANPDAEKAKGKARYSANREERKAASKAWYLANKETALAGAKIWREANKERVLEYAREYSARWRAANPERNKEAQRQYQRTRRENPKHRLEGLVANGVTRGLKKGSKRGRRTFAILGYTVDELSAHIERQFLPGMSWENYGRGGWDVEHIIPLAAHNYQTTDDIDFKRAWALSNLRPMWSKDNKIKGAKLSSPFQPSFAFSAANDNNEEAAA